MSMRDAAGYRSPQTVKTERIYKIPMADVIRELGIQEPDSAGRSAEIVQGYLVLEYIDTKTGQ